MTRKPHIQVHYNTGDKRIKEAAERAWLEINGIQKMLLSEEFDICKAFGYPVELLKTDDEYTITLTPKYNPYDHYPFEIINGEMYVFGVRCTDIDGYFWPIKDLPFDNLGI